MCAMSCGPLGKIAGPNGYAPSSDRVAGHVVSNVSREGLFSYFQPGATALPLEAISSEGARMWILILGLVLFFGVHSVRMVAAGYRDAQLAANEKRWKGLYSLVSLAGVLLIILGWVLGGADNSAVYTPPEWGRHVTMLLVWVAFILLASANMPAGRIKQWVKHPMLLGVGLWALGHLLANGDLFGLLTFGAFLVYAVVNRIAVISRGDPAPVVVRPRSDIVAIGAGTVLYLVFVFALHQWLFGVSPLQG